MIDEKTQLADAILRLRVRFHSRLLARRGIQAAENELEKLVADFDDRAVQHRFRMREPRRSFNTERIMAPAVSWFRALFAAK